MPLTFRLIYHGVRAAIRAGLLLLCAWLILIPATSEEAEALGASSDTQYPVGLRPMRTARVIVAVAPEPIYSLAAVALGPNFSSLTVKLIMLQMAQGNVLPEGASFEEQSDRDLDGPRFIQVD